MKPVTRKRPQLGFKNFDEPWEQKRLGDITSIKTGKLNANAMVKNGKYDFYTSGIKKYRIDIPAFSGPAIIIAGNGATVGYMHLADGQFNAYQRTYVLTDFKGDRLFLFSEIGKWLPKKIAEEAREGNIPYIVMDMLTDLRVDIPNGKQEQQKIGSFFKQLDELITLCQHQLDQLKALKEGYLQKMFPRNGAKVPELRFKGFADDWEQRKLGEMLDERNEQIPENDEYPLMSFVKGTGVTPKGNQYDRSFLVKSNNKKYKKTELGDFIYSSNNLETGSIGFNQTGKAVISPVYSIFSSKNQLESQFIGILSTRKYFINKMIRYRQGVVYGQWRINEKDFLNIKILAPSHKEQKEIIVFFKEIDNLITLNQRKLDKLKELKKAYLQKMFC